MQQIDQPSLPVDLRGQVLATTILLSYFIDLAVRKNLVNLDEVETIFANTSMRITLVCQSLNFSEEEVKQIEHEAESLLDLLSRDLPQRSFYAGA